MKICAKQTVGMWIAIAYIFLQPLMLQNPLKPILSHGFGALQIADILFPLMLIWIIWCLWDAIWTGKFIASALRYRSFLIAIGILITSFLLGGSAAGYSPRFMDFAKIGYLMGLLIFFMLALGTVSTLALVFRVLVYASIGLMLLSISYYVLAFFFGYSSNFAQIREGFPYLGRVVRLNGPMQPTSKLFGMYMLYLSLLLMLGKHLISLKVWRLALVLLIVCSFLTLGRVGLVAVVSAILGVAAFSSNRFIWFSLMAAPLLVVAFAVQALTIWHIDITNLILNCSVEYEIERQSQYFGWYGEPTMCIFNLNSGITFSSYFLMKLVAWNAWLSHPLFGIGVYQYESVWTAAAGFEIQNFFKNFPFPMAQSTYLTLLAEVGLFGFAAWFGLINLFFWRIWVAIRSELSMRWMFLSWVACFFYALVDLDVHNFRFVYSLMPIALGLSMHFASQCIRNEVF